MSTNSFYKSDLPDYYNIVQNTMIRYPKDLIIDILKKFFSNDKYYKFEKDEWGFSKTPSNKDLDLTAGIDDNLCTRIFIGDHFRKELAFYPAILVKHNSTRSVNVSASREYGCIQYDKVFYEDGYGHSQEVSIPRAHILAGRWEGTLSIDILARSIYSRDELTELVTICLADLYFDEMVQNGLTIKPPNVSGTSEQDYRNDKVFRATVNIDYMSEWRREIPITNLVQKIAFIIDFVDLYDPGAQSSEDFRIQTDVEISDYFLNLF